MNQRVAARSCSALRKSEGFTTVKKVLEKRSIRSITATSRLASAVVNASTSLESGYGSEFALETMKPCWPWLYFPPLTKNRMKCDVESSGESCGDRPTWIAGLLSEELI